MERGRKRKKKFKREKVSLNLRQPHFQIILGNCSIIEEELKKSKMVGMNVTRKLTKPVGWFYLQHDQREQLIKYFSAIHMDNNGSRSCKWTFVENYRQFELLSKQFFFIKALFEVHSPMFSELWLDILFSASWLVRMYYTENSKKVAGRKHEVFARRLKYLDQITAIAMWKTTEKKKLVKITQTIYDITYVINEFDLKNIPEPLILSERLNLDFWKLNKITFVKKNLLN